MTLENNESKLALFDEFFSIEYNFNINACVIEERTLPSYEQFLNDMPMPFKMASEIHVLDQSALRPLQAVSGVANQLMEYLNHQAKKMDLLVGYIIDQLNTEEARFQAIKFGGGGVIFQSEEATTFKTGNYIELKLFFPAENNAIYCIGEIVSSTAKGNVMQHKVIFHHIREEDRELLVRNSLHQQSKQLQALAQERNKKE